ncbi:GGDEF domain-containing protein [Paractinoplanes ferrugineus]|uniref:GGDEF domain-containing protein n=1 Tax=Paractinoplanes ferrugineus TaxID=113564 RepID=UPI001EF28749|nr:GGDEF domain-containing protein [Actinoplanes ferrugineus]
MDRSDRESLSAALLELEDEINWDAAGMLERATRIERQARQLGDDLLVARARLSQANLHMRAGDLAGAARRIWKVHQWAAEHEARQLTARTHLVWAGIHRHLGDVAQCLEHSILSVELLDDDATEHMRIWHRAKLADALSLAGSMDAARLRYRQAADLARRLRRPDLQLAVLNNYAYAEFAAGHHEEAQSVAAWLQRHAEAHGFELDAALLDTIGAIQIENRQYATAERTLLSCIDRHYDGNQDDADALAEYLLTLARAQRCLGAYGRAQRSLNASRRLCAERELGHVLVKVHQEQAELYAARGEFAEAFAAHKDFFAAHTEQHSLRRQAQARTRQAMFETAEARQEAERFREQARRDPLTGLRNRRFLNEQLPGLIESDPELTVAMVDLDHYKRINDRLSHEVGDRVLVQVARLLERAAEDITPDAFVVRMGGEEFLLALPQTPAGRATAALDELRQTIKGHDWEPLTAGLPVTVSIGVACVGDFVEPAQITLLSTADRHLYAAKHGGRDRVVSSVTDSGQGSRAPAA